MPYVAYDDCKMRGERKLSSGPKSRRNHCFNSEIDHDQRKERYVSAAELRSRGEKKERKGRREEAERVEKAVDTSHLRRLVGATHVRSHRPHRGQLAVNCKSRFGANAKPPLPALDHGRGQARRRRGSPAGGAAAERDCRGSLAHSCGCWMARSDGRCFFVRRGATRSQEIA